MKALRNLLCTVIAFTMVLPLSVLADDIYVDNFVSEVGELDCPYGTPVIDGAIGTGEGWSAEKYIDKTNTDGCWGGEEVVITGNIYRAWDENNLYIAADINIPELILCTAEDDIEEHVTGNKPGWNGDVFIYSIDPLQALLNEGFAKEAAPWYCFGIFEGGEIRTYRTHLNDGEITDKVSAKGAITESGWRFEAAIPWTVICTDIEEHSLGTAALTPEIVAKADSKISGSMIYYDRIFDPEQNGNITGSRYVTIANVLPDGTPGVNCSGWILDAHGMHFMLSGGPSGNGGEDNAGAAGGIGGSAGTNSNNTGNNSNTNTNTNTNNPASTDSANKGNSTGTSSPQTYDNAFGYAAIALFIAAAALHFITRNKTVDSEKSN